MRMTAFYSQSYRSHEGRTQLLRSFTKENIPTLRLVQIKLSIFQNEIFQRNTGLVINDV